MTYRANLKEKKLLLALARAGKIKIDLTTNEGMSKITISAIDYLLNNDLVKDSEIVEYIGKIEKIETFLSSKDGGAFDLEEAKAVATEVNKKHCEKFKLIPFKKVETDQGTLFKYLTYNPYNDDAQRNLAFFHKNTVSFELVATERSFIKEHIEDVLDDGIGASDGVDDDELDGVEETRGDDDDQGVDADSGNDAPVVKFVNTMLVKAIKMGASDLHFEPYEKEYRVRFRVDGVLKTVSKPPINVKTKVAARLKIMSDMDIANKKSPQDGRIKLKLTKTKSIDFRVNSLPTLFGEKIVLRILDSSSAKLGIDMLGYEDTQKKLYLENLYKPQGMILVTGPTGSGKTVSLYTGLNIINTEDRNISTAEDPVEINLMGINQVNVNPKQGLTFESALKAFLRQDPDVIMVGEIRDLDTATIAIKAAQTGHMVMSTLHTNSASETLTRLKQMGVPPFNIASAVSLVIAQRLARRLCENCKIPDETIPDLKKQEFEMSDEEANSELYTNNPDGCGSCSKGYKGRVGIYEVLPITKEIQEIILADGNANEIAKVQKKVGVNDLRRSAVLKALQGTTNLDEVRRVTA